MRYPKTVKESQRNEEGPGDSSEPPSGVFDEPGSKIWKPYLDQADKYDKDLVDRWRDDMDTILIFAALFSASVTAFVIESYKNLQADTDNIAVNILLQISKQLANGTQAGAAVLPPPFLPGSSNVAVNICWFLSLGFSLVCAIAAVMVRQWARHYLSVPRDLASTNDRARMREYLYENVELWQMEVVVDTIPALLHISLILFFAGLLLFLHLINSQVALSMLCFCAVGAVTYILLTITPILFPGSPYRTPFSGFLLLLLEVMWNFIIRLAIRLFGIVAVYITVLSRGGQFVRQEFLNDLSVIIGQDARPIISIYRAFGRTAAISYFLSYSRANSLSYGLHRNSFSNWAIKTLRFRVQERRYTLATSQPARRDVLALKRTMDFSKRDTDLIAIMEAVPDYLQPLVHHSAGNSVLGREVYTAQAILVAAGIDKHLTRFLLSCVEGGILKVSAHVIISWMEAVNWLTRCPAAFWDPSLVDDAFVHDASLPVVPFHLHINCDIDKTPWDTIFPADDRTSLLFRCTLSRLLLGQVYQAEKLFKQNLEQADDNAHALDKKINHYNQAVVMRQMAEGSAYLLRLEDGMEDASEALANGWFPLARASDRFSTETLYNLESFRQRCALWIVAKFTPAALLEPMVFDSLCDAATHLRPFPASTAHSEVAVFRLLDLIQRHHEPPDLLQAVYGHVLWDEGSLMVHQKKRFSSHLEFHSLFFERVRVQDGPYDPSTRKIQIVFKDYCRILYRLAESLDGSSEMNYLEIYAETICNILQHRLRGVADTSEGGSQAAVVDDNQGMGNENQAAVNEDQVMAENNHLAIVCALRQKTTVRGLEELLQETADSFGYGLTLDRMSNVS